MDKRYYTSIGILLGLVLVAWAFGPSNYEPMERNPVADSSGNNQNIESSSENLVESATDPVQHSYKPTLVTGGAGSASRIPKSLFNGTWTAGQANQTEVNDTTDEKTGSSHNQSSNPANGRGLSYKKNSSRTGRPNAILLGAVNSKAVQNSQASVSLGFPSIGPGNRKSAEINSNRKRNTQEDVSVTERIPGRSKQADDLAMNSTKQGKETRPNLSFQKKAPELPLPAVSSHFSSNIQKNRRQGSLAANLDMQALAKQLAPIRKGASNASALSSSPVQVRQRPQRPPIETDPLFRPVIDPRTSKPVGTRGASNSMAGVRGLPFAMTGQGQNQFLQGSTGKRKVGIPGQQNRSETRKPIGRIPTYEQEYIWHVLSSNETLESIATSYDGGPAMVQKIVKMNKDVFQDPNLLPVGKAIRVPVQ